MMWFDSFKTPIGRLVLAADERGLRHVLFETNRYLPTDRDTWKRDAAAVRDAREQLLAYFAGERRTFALELQPVGTPFQLKVWQALTEIPFGATCSYGEIARRIGDPKAVRAVGAANGRNPLPIVVPCHRVIGSNGKLCGFTCPQGLAMKEKLLEREGASRQRNRKAK